MGHHSTSDDSTAYRPKEEIGMWSATENPVGKFRRYLETKGLWSEEEEKSWAKDSRKQVLAASCNVKQNNTKNLIDSGCLQQG